MRTDNTETVTMRYVVTAGALALAFAGIALTGSARAQYVKPGYWNISVKFPRYVSKGPVAAKANAESRRNETAEAKAFLASARKEVPELKKELRKARYELRVKPTVGMDPPDISSGYVERYAATGGAHGDTTFSVHNFGKTASGVKALTLQDLFLKEASGIDEASAALLDVLSKQNPVLTSVASGGWKSLSPAQARKFVITKQGLLFLFDQQELGSSAEGARKVLVPFNLLPGLNREGILKQVLASAAPAIPFTLTSGRWKLVSIQYNDDRTFKSDAGDDNWIEFLGGRVSGKAGINRFNGSFSADPDGRLKFGPLAMTRAANPPGSISEHYERRITEVTRYLFRGKNLILELPYDTGILVFSR